MSGVVLFRQYRLPLLLPCPWMCTLLLVYFAALSCFYLTFLFRLVFFVFLCFVVVSYCRFFLVIFCFSKGTLSGCACHGFALAASLGLTPNLSFLITEFLLEELKVLCEHSARKIVSVANVAKMLLAAERYQAETLKTACLSFVQKNMPEVSAIKTTNDARERFVSSPFLRLLLLCL